jgi:glycosyltransferase involved in cell wall biosynthesis
MKRLTLGVLTFNNGRYLQELLSSIDTQKNRDFSVLIVNNGSSDSSAEIIRDFEKQDHDFDLRVIDNELNYGSFSGTKQLIFNCNTSHLSIIHGDDLLKDTYSDTANNFIKLNPDVCGFNFDLVEIEENENSATGTILQSSWTQFKTLNRLLVSGLNPGVMPGAILNLEKIDRNFLIEEFEETKLNGVEDILIWLKIIRSSERIKRVPVAAYFYRRHNGQISKNFGVYGASLGYVRKLNFLTSTTLLEKLLCLSEINHEFFTVNFDDSYLKGLGSLSKYRIFSIFRFLNILTRRTSKMINNISYFN